MPCLVWLLIVLMGSFCCIAQANVDQDSSGHSKLMRLFPHAIKFAPISEQLEMKERIEDRLEIIGRRKSSRTGASFVRSTRMKNYIDTIKRYSQLRLTDKLALTVGTVKAAPLGAKERQLIETNKVFHSKLHNGEKARGYGLKFKFQI